MPLLLRRLPAVKELRERRLELQGVAMASVGQLEGGREVRQICIFRRAWARALAHA